MFKKSLAQTLGKANKFIQELKDGIESNGDLIEQIDTEVDQLENQIDSLEKDAELLMKENRQANRLIGLLSGSN
jgi:uncharacterized protein Yka (UPF0111/DUF47 family)